MSDNQWLWQDQLFESLCALAVMGGANTPIPDKDNSHFDNLRRLEFRHMENNQFRTDLSLRLDEKTIERLDLQTTHSSKRDAWLLVSNLCTEDGPTEVYLSDYALYCIEHEYIPTPEWYNDNVMPKEFF